MIWFTILVRGLSLRSKKMQAFSDLDEFAFPRTGVTHSKKAQDNSCAFSGSPTYLTKYSIFLINSSDEYFILNLFQYVFFRSTKLNFSYIDNGLLVND